MATAETTERVYEVIEDHVGLRWEDLLEAVSDDVDEDTLGDALDELQDEGRVAYSGRRGYLPMEVWDALSAASALKRMTGTDAPVAVDADEDGPVTVSLEFTVTVDRD
jgi:hypothetical protein